MEACASDPRHVPRRYQATDEAWPPLAGVPANRLSAHQETYPRSGVSVERSRRGSVSEVMTAVWAGSRSLGKNLDVGDLPLQEPRQGLGRQPIPRLLL